jgi:hypothetical protein
MTLLMQQRLPLKCSVVGTKVHTTFMTADAPYKSGTERNNESCSNQDRWSCTLMLAWKTYRGNVRSVCACIAVPKECRFAATGLQQIAPRRPRRSHSMLQKDGAYGLTREADLAAESVPAICPDYCLSVSAPSAPACPVVGHADPRPVNGGKFGMDHIRMNRTPACQDWCGASETIVEHLSQNSTLL